MSDEPNIDELLDKGFGSPAAGADNSDASPAATDKAPEAPAEAEGEVDYSRTVNTEDAWTRAIFNREMHKVGEMRNRFRTYEELEARLEADPDFRARFEQGMNGQAPEAPSPTAPPAWESRLARLERERADERAQAHFDAVDQAAGRIAAEYKLSEKDLQSVIQSAVKAGTLHAGVPNKNLHDVLDMAAARFVLPRAAANGQRALLDQIKDKGRTASPTRESAQPPEPEPDVTKMSERDYTKYLIGIAEKAGRGTS